MQSFFWYVFYALAIMGLFWQGYEVSRGYFSFDVITTLTFSASESNRPKEIYVRLIYYEALDRESYEKDTGTKLLKDTAPLEMYYSMVNFTEQMSIDDIMKYTPPADNNMIDWCDHRSEIECDPKSISVSKFVNNVFILYRFRFNYKESDTFDEASVFYTPNNYAVISFILFKPEYFKNVHIISTFLNCDDEIPFTENAIGLNTDTDYDYERKIQKYLSFGLRGHSMITRTLPPPHVTRCRKNYKMYQCLTKCINEFTTTNFDRLAPLAYYQESHLKQMTYSDMKNHSRYSAYRHYIRKCQTKCPDKECIKEMVITHVERSAVGPMNFYQTLSDSPSFIVITDPKVVLADYLTLIMSCFGAWLGLSVISFNPFKRKAIPKNVSNQAIAGVQKDGMQIQTLENIVDKLSKDMRYVMIQNQMLKRAISEMRK